MYCIHWGALINLCKNPRWLGYAKRGPGEVQ